MLLVRRGTLTNTLAERTLPHDLSAERAVLGAVLLHNDAYETVTGILSTSDFFRDAHRRVWKAIDSLLEWKGGSVDLVTLMDELTKHGDLDECGGPSYLTALTDGVPRSSNVRAYASIVKEKSRLRGLIFAANKMLSAAYDAEESSSEVLQHADRALVALQADTGAEHLIPLRATTSPLLENLEWRVAHKGEVTGIETGYPQINALTLGWQPGDLIVLAARPSIGKTTLAMNTAVAGARAGKRIAVFSFEMKRQQLEYRMLASLSGVPFMRVTGGYLMECDWSPISTALGQMAELPISIDDRRGQNVHDIQSACRRMKAEEGLDSVIIDYIQLIPGSLDRRGATRNDEIADISRRLSGMAGDLSVPVLLLSQMSRANDKRPDPRPKLSDLRDSGALEQDADQVCFLHRRNHREGGVTSFIMEKQRNGPTGTLNLTLDRDILLFTDGGEEPEPAKEVAPSRPRRYRRDSEED